MESIEDLKKRAQCQKCHKTYENGSQKYVFEICEHHMCTYCLKNSPVIGFKCSICGNASFACEVTVHHDTATALLSIHELSVAESAKVEADLRNRISILEQKWEQWRVLTDDYHTCADCETFDYEQDMQLCSTCHGLKFEDLEDVKKNALCPACAIKKHMRKGHQIVDFFPYLSAYNFSTHSPKIELKSKELENARGSLNNTFSDFNILSINASESYDVLTDMARRSKTIGNQLEFIEKMETLINESKSIHVGADSELKEKTKLLQESLTKIKDWYNTRMDDCVDESEIIKLEAPN